MTAQTNGWDGMEREPSRERLMLAEVSSDKVLPDWRH